jgi:hypothetical protein
MSTRLKFCLLLLVLGASGCAVVETTQVVPRSEWAELSDDCSALLAASSDEEIVVSLAEGSEDSVVLEAPSSACVAARQTMASKAAAARRFELFQRLRVPFRGGDPSPHPDEPTRQAEDPSPHPDAQGGGDGDPSPHPDANNDDSDTGAIVLQVVGFVPLGASNGDNANAARQSPAATNAE